jgi:hypothetical protein
MPTLGAGFHQPFIKSEVLSLNCEVRNISDFALYTSDLNVVRYSDEISNFRLIPDYLKVVDFIEEMDKGQIPDKFEMPNLKCEFLSLKCEVRNISHFALYTSDLK